MLPRIRSVQDPTHEAVGLIQAAINPREPTLLLLSAGSIVPVYQQLAGHLNASNLTLGLIDERYDPNPRHADANEPKIRQALGALGGKLTGILHGRSLEAEAAAYEAFVRPWFEDSDRHIVAVLGIGTDGHTAGILPNSDADWFNDTFDGSNLVAGYHNDGPYPDRITVTLPLLRRVNHTVVLAAGTDKQAVIERLSSGQDTPLNELPAAIVYQMPQVDIVTNSSR